VSDIPGSDTPDPVRRALDLFVFAPVGVALTMAEDLPALIDKGRRRFDTDVRNARVVGQFFVVQGQRQLAQRVGKLLHNDNDNDNDPPAPRAEPASAVVPEVDVTPPRPAADPADGIIVEAALAGYDTLSASQVVRRLESLGPAELRAVHRHEASHRNRRTILNRAQQLLEGAGPDRPIG
jgi:hypothetical protein